MARFHIDAALSNFAEQFSQSGIWIADQVLKPIPVVKESDKFHKFYLKDIITIPGSTQRAIGSPANHSRFEVTNDTYACEEYAWKDLVADRDRDNADAPLALEQDSTMRNTEIIMNDKEANVATAVFNATTFSSYTSALTGGDRWDVYDSSNPYGDIETAKESVLKNSLRMANTIIMGYEVFKKIRHHPDLIERVKYTGSIQNPAVLNEVEMARAFDVEKVLVGRAVYNSANYGQTATPAFIWGKYVMTAYIPNVQPRKGVTLGASFRSQNVQARKWYDEELKGTWVETSVIQDEKIVTTGAGYLHSTVVS